MNVREDDPFIVESTLTIMDLTSHDSGPVSCNATVTTLEGVPYVNQMVSQLSVLGELVTCTSHPEIM